MDLAHPPVSVAPAPAAASNDIDRRVLVAVEPTNEEWIAASHALRMLSSETCDAPQI